MKVRDMLRRLKEDGWKLDRTRGDHRQFVHPAKPGIVTVPGHEGDDLTSGNAKLDMEANGCVLHSGHHKILCSWATRGRYQWWRPEGYLSQAQIGRASCRERVHIVAFVL